MLYRRQETRDHFWVGFLTGVVAGGVLGALFASEAGRGARDRLESAVDDVRSRFNGKHVEPRDEHPAEAAPQEEERPS